MVVDQATCRMRLQELLELLRAYRGWSKEELGRGVGRDSSHIVPWKNYPGLDLLARVAEGLDWSIGELIEILIAPEEDDELERPEEQGLTALEIDALLRRSFSEGDDQEAIRLSKVMYRHASTSHERAVSFVRQHAVWDRLGRYQASIDVIQRAIDEYPADLELQRVIESNLANSYYMLWHLTEAEALAGMLVRRYEQDGEDSVNHCRTHAFARFVLGNVKRRRLSVMAPDDPSMQQVASESKSLLLDAARRYRALPVHSDASGSNHRTVANIAIGGFAEAAVTCGAIDPGRALTRLRRGVEAAVIDKSASQSRLESYGWWCVCACNIAVRHLEGAEQLRQLAVFTGHAAKIAADSGNWSLNERAFSLDWTRRDILREMTGIEEEWVLDPERLRKLAGVLGRFPTFYERGLHIYRNATVRSK